MSDAERKAWRRGRQIRPGPIQHRSDDSRRDAEVSMDGEMFPTATQSPWTRQTEPVGQLYTPSSLLCADPLPKASYAVH